MTIPLNNLYHYVQGRLKLPAAIYLFYPHGSKKINDLGLLQPMAQELLTMPSIICHDQEPLNFDFYLDQTQEIQNLNQTLQTYYADEFNLPSLCPPTNQNLATKLLRFNYGVSIFDQSVLLHSEINSNDVTKYKNTGFIPAYYWSHAIISRDWYRFAQYDQRLNAQTDKHHLFLIHCRGWSHTREYRLKFLECIGLSGLMPKCQVSILHKENNVSFTEHKFENKNFQIYHYDILKNLPQNQFCSDSSADYTPQEFNNSLISVILETEFDSNRIHLTEKICRALACAHPFILAAGPLSLMLLRHYGFKTFSPWIDESYDYETDSYTRLQKIVTEMQRIAKLPPAEIKQIQKNIQDIANFNKQRFFSSAFMQQITKELDQNLNAAVELAYQTRGKNFLEHKRQLKQTKNSQCINFAKSRHPFHVLKTMTLRQLRQQF